MNFNNLQDLLGIDGEAQPGKETGHNGRRDKGSNLWFASKGKQDEDEGSNPSITSQGYEDTGCGKRKRLDTKGVITTPRAAPVEEVSSKIYKFRNQQKKPPWRKHQSVYHKEREQ